MTNDPIPGRERTRQSRPFDATTKHLIETYPTAWLAYLGLPTAGPVSVIDANLSTVLAEADKVLHLEAPSPWLVHIELQVSADRQRHPGRTTIRRPSDGRADTD